MQNQMPLEQAFNLIDQALGQLNANRETHALLATSVQRVKNEIVMLNQQLAVLEKEYHETLDADFVPSTPASNSDPS